MTDPVSSKNSNLRKSKLCDAAGNGVLFSGKKILKKGTNTNETNNKRKSLEVINNTNKLNRGFHAGDSQESGHQDSKPISRKQTFKEFEEKFKISKSKRLLKSQSLDNTPACQHQSNNDIAECHQPSTKDVNQGGMKELSRRARDVFRHKATLNATAKNVKDSTDHLPVEDEVIAQKSLMSRIFHR